MTEKNSNTIHMLNLPKIVNQGFKTHRNKSLIYKTKDNRVRAVETYYTNSLAKWTILK